MSVRRISFRAAGAFLLATLLALSGCSVGPRYRRPQPPVPQAWNTQPSAQTSQFPAADWWRGFGSATLDQYIDEALRDSDDIAAAVARVREADAQVRIAGALLLPSVGLSADAVRQKSFSPVTGLSGPPNNEFSAVLSASYELDFWGKNRAARQAAVSVALGSDYDRETVVLSTLSAVADDYFQALEMRDRLQVAMNNVANAQHILDGLQLEEQVGTTTALDVAQQAAVVAVENASIPPLQQQLKQSMNALAILLGRNPEALAFRDASLEQITAPLVSAGLPAELLARRPDVALAEAQLHAANANIVEARAAFFPNVTLTADGGFASAALDTLLNPAHRIFSISGGIAQAIFEGGALRGQYQFTQSRYGELLADYHKSVISAFSDVEDALVAAQQTGEQQRRQQVATAAAQRAYDYAQQQMAAGVTNILTVLNTETTLFTAEDALVQVKFQHLTALVHLYQALGGGWQQAQATSL